MPLQARILWWRGWFIRARRFYRRTVKSRTSVLTVEMDVYADGTMDFLSVSQPGDFLRVRDAMGRCIGKLRQQLRDEKQCPFHPCNYPADAANRAEHKEMP